MANAQAWLRKLQFYFSSVAIYGLTLAFAWYVVQPGGVLAATKPPPLTASASKTSKPKQVEISGRPVRIVIPASGIDLPVDPGDYDPVKQTWTLSGYRAHFATMSKPANNIEGDTFIYGHNNNYVFGALRKVTPAPGAQAMLYTDNGHIFEYAYQSVKTVGPTDAYVFKQDGSPVMTILTCTGALNEWRTLFRFNFVRVIQ